MLQLGPVYLNVLDLPRLSQFYQEIVGLSVLSKTKAQIVLGIQADQRPLVILQQATKEDKQTAGLYHLAILVPTRLALSEVLHHLIQCGVALEGGADHGYSEALYFHDLEGNGIEIYRDKPQKQWDVRSDGRIIGVTEELAAQEIYEMISQVSEPFVLPQGTKMGHVHLAVGDALASSKRYQALLDMQEKHQYAKASWIASGSYHHHLAFNQWQRRHTVHQDKQAGLSKIGFVSDQAAELLAIASRASKLGFQIKHQTTRQLQLLDTDGIAIQIDYQH
ncbi:VOC family protein [Enterococcus cecorum]|uniref:VOC family protein n=1 Tax=Enterococcus cecorum TaxID=44008 RepID=A0AAW8TR36_9ENTE|nr:VOC family protein [Enterococcus cecorum]MDT2797264.1 VOC family protein [Enterococcus cecorum]